jgi:hypothetical protein
MNDLPAEARILNESSTGAQLALTWGSVLAPTLPL